MNRELRLDVVYDAIIDNPFATEDDKREMLDFLLEIPRPFKLYLYSLNFFPKTKITLELLEKGIITEKDVEGVATKAWRQFRVSMDYPQAEGRHFLALPVSACVEKLCSQGADQDTFAIIISEAAPMAALLCRKVLQPDQDGRSGVGDVHPRRAHAVQDQAVRQLPQDDLAVMHRCDDRDHHPCDRDQTQSFW